MTSFYDFSAQRLDGGVQSMADYRGKVLLVVNVASKCGFTPQYEGLEALWREYGPRGFAVLGFPCNQFGDQEPGKAAEIAAFCSTFYDVSFPMFAKIEVNGPNADPLYKFLTSSARGFLGGKKVKWNFTKFLINREGAPVKRVASRVESAAIRPRIEALI